MVKIMCDGHKRIEEIPINEFKKFKQVICRQLREKEEILKKKWDAITFYHVGD